MQRSKVLVRVKDGEDRLPCLGQQWFSRHQGVTGEDRLAAMPGEQRKWVIDAGASYKIEGFYKDASGTYSPFDVLGEEESVRLYSNLSEQFAALVNLPVREHAIARPAPASA